MSLDDIVNVDLLANPFNWLVVIGMLAISTFILGLALGQLGQVGGFINLSGAMGLADSGTD